MKNVNCNKLLIDRTKAPDKVGTLKDISLYGSFHFPTAGPYSGGLVARSLAGTGKELQKTKGQIQALANRTRPIARATGATTTEEVCCQAGAVAHGTSEEPYSVRFVQHAVVDRVLPVEMVTVEEDMASNYATNPGYALKVGGAKRVLFTLEQKEIMIEFYNRQANYGIRADADDCAAEMRARGITALKKSQITSWWSTYHQKRRRGSEQLAADLQQRRSTPATTVQTSAEIIQSNSSTVSATNTVPAASTVPTTSAMSTGNTVSPTSTMLTANTVPTASTTCMSTLSTVSTASTMSAVSTISPASTMPTVSTISTASTMSTASTVSPTSTMSTASSVSPTSSMSTASTVPTASCSILPSAPPAMTLTTGMLGRNVSPGVTEWYFPHTMSQSTIDNRNGSNACVFIAFNFGLLYQRQKLDNTLVGQCMNIQRQAALEKAIRDGNEMHRALFDDDGINVAVDDAIALAGDHCQVGQISAEYNVFGANPIDQMETVIRSLSLQKSSFHVLVTNGMAMLLIVDSHGTIIFIDSHVHGSRGAVISRFTKDTHSQARMFSVWLNDMLTQTSAGISICAISSISYHLV